VQTGANGLTGTHLVNAAVLVGWQVEGLTANLKDALGISEQTGAFQPIAIVHLGAISAVTHADMNAFYGVNVIGTDNLPSAAARANIKPRQVILASRVLWGRNCWPFGRINAGATS
jgi:GDP-6-deoxy-D-talose 4-dehydrogenase